MAVKSQDCDICGERGKYNCPRCDTRSCSVQCVKQHKNLSGCDGQRKKVKYIPLKEFSELDLVQDFRILENATTTVDKCRRDKLKRSTRQSVDGFCAPRVSKAIKKLQYESQRFGTKVKILPPHFVKRKNNSSHFDFKTKSLYWDIDLHLPSVNRTMNLKTIQDKTKLWKIIGRIFEESEQLVSLPLDGWTSEELDVYRSVGYGGIRLYLKCESLPNEGRDFHHENSNFRSESKELRHFYPLDLKRSLRHNLRDKVLVEHPVIHIVMKDEECNYREEADCFDLVKDCAPDSVKVEPVEPLGDGESEEKSRFPGETSRFPGESERFPGESTRFPGETTRFPGAPSRFPGAPGRHPGDDFEGPPSVGMMFGEEDNMEADPEAYKQYFDFYLNYYTQKYARQAPAHDPNLPPSTLESRQTLPSAFSVLQNSSKPPPTFPQGNMNVPPPNMINGRRVPPPPMAASSKPNAAAVNLSNVENARKIAAEIREENKSGGLGLLAAYSDSDSE